MDSSDSTRIDILSIPCGDTFVYTHSKPDGTVFYVGIGIPTRPYDFRQSARNNFWLNIVNKYGKPTVSIVARYSDRAEAEAHEVRLIAELSSKGIKLANLTLGGEKNKGLDARARERASKIARQHHLDNPEAGERHSKFMAELWKDAEHRENTKARQVEGRIISNWAQRHSETMKKVWEGRSEEMSARTKSHFADPVKREHMLKNRIRSVAAYTSDGKLHSQYASVAEAADAVGVNRSCIVAAAKKNVKTSAGLVWEYILPKG